MSKTNTDPISGWPVALKLEPVSLSSVIYKLLILEADAICKVQGKTYKETKEIDKVKINIKDVKLLIKEVLGINVTIL